MTDGIQDRSFSKHIEGDGDIEMDPGVDDTPDRPHGDDPSYDGGEPKGGGHGRDIGHPNEGEGESKGGDGEEGHDFPLKQGDIIPHTPGAERFGNGSFEDVLGNRHDIYRDHFGRTWLYHIDKDGIPHTTFTTKEWNENIQRYEHHGNEYDDEDEELEAEGFPLPEVDKQVFKDFSNWAAELRKRHRHKIAKLNRLELTPHEHPRAEFDIITERFQSPPTGIRTDRKRMRELDSTYDTPPAGGMTTQVLQPAKKKQIFEDRPVPGTILPFTPHIPEGEVFRDWINMPGGNRPIPSVELPKGFPGTEGRIEWRGFPFRNRNAGLWNTVSSLEEARAEGPVALAGYYHDNAYMMAENIEQIDEADRQFLESLNAIPWGERNALWMFYYMGIASHAGRIRQLFL